MTRRRWIALGVFGVFVGWFGHFAYLRITLRPTPRPEYWEAKLAEVDPPPPGAIAWSKARSLIANRPWAIDPAVTAIKDFDVTKALDDPWDEKRPDLAAVVGVLRSDAFEKARAALGQGVSAGWYEPIALNPSTPLPTLAPWRDWAKWLTARSRWVRQHDPHAGLAAATDDWLIAIRIGRQVRRSQILIHHLVEAAIDALMAEEMMLAAKESPGAIDTCRLARQIDELIGPPMRPSELLRGESIWLHCHLDDVYVREGGDWLDVSECARFSWSNGTFGATPSRLWNVASPLFHDLPTARTLLDRHLAWRDAYKDISACEREGNAATPGFSLGRPTALDGLGDNIPDYARFISRCYGARCQLDAATAMLALAQYHRRNGGYPERLTDLVPVYLPRLPIDYADRQPLRYRRTQDGYLLYSIGLDGKDEGGAAGPDSPALFDEKNVDVVFSAARRKKVEK